MVREFEQRNEVDHTILIKALADRLVNNKIKKFPLFGRCVTYYVFLTKG
jgi:hypothetical protein